MTTLTKEPDLVQKDRQTIQEEEQRPIYEDHDIVVSDVQEDGNLPPLLMTTLTTWPLFFDSAKPDSA